MNSKTIRNIIFVSAMLLPITGHAQRSSSPDGEWRLSQLNGRNLTTSRASIQINTDTRRFTGNAGCNQMFGTVVVTVNRIVFSNMGTTRKFCGARTSRIEAEFLNTLRSVNRFTRTGRALDMYARNRIVLRFAGVGTQPNEPGGPTGGVWDGRWTLDSIGGRKVGPDAYGAFINFDPAKKSSGGNTGCNLFGGSYTVSGTRIAITDVISTMRACEEGDRMTIERQFLDGLRDANRYLVRGAELTLFRDTEVLLTFRR